jgi:hypothetical protein
MAYPITFTPFPWENLPAEGTPLDKEKFQAAEKALAKFVEEFELHWRAPVKKFSELPKEVKAGDVCLVEEQKILYAYSGTEWIVPEFIKPEAKYAAQVERKHGIEYEASATRPVFVVMRVSAKGGEECALGPTIGGVGLTSIKSAAPTAADQLVYTVIVPAGQKWKATIKGSSPAETFFTTYFEL